MTSPAAQRDGRVMAWKKRGFAASVVDGWLQSSARGVLPEMLLDESSLMFNLLEPQSVRQVLEEHRSGREDNH